LAAERGITVEESRTSESSGYSGLLRLSLETDQGTMTLAGTLVGSDRPRLVEVDGLAIESEVEGHLLFFRNLDLPGVVGKIGTILGRAGVNIADLRLGRLRGDDREAVSIINVDHPVRQETLAEIRGVEEILFARAVEV
jgi:D-3-phosphoglycerate dehydrogenase